MQDVKPTSGITSEELLVLKENSLGKYSNFISKCLIEMKGTDKENLFQTLYNYITNKDIILSILQILRVKTAIIELKTKVSQYAHLDDQILLQLPLTPEQRTPNIEHPKGPPTIKITKKTRNDGFRTIASSTSPDSTTDVQEPSASNYRPSSRPGRPTKTFSYESSAAYKAQSEMYQQLTHMMAPWSSERTVAPVNKKTSQVPAAAFGDEIERIPKGTSKKTPKVVNEASKKSQAPAELVNKLKTSKKSHVPIDHKKSNKKSTSLKKDEKSEVHQSTEEVAKTSQPVPEGKQVSVHQKPQTSVPEIKNIVKENVGRPKKEVSLTTQLSTQGIKKVGRERLKKKVVKVPQTLAQEDDLSLTLTSGEVGQITSEPEVDQQPKAKPKFIEISGPVRKKRLRTKSLSENVKPSDDDVPLVSRRRKSCFSDKAVKKQKVNVQGNVKENDFKLKPSKIISSFVHEFEDYQFISCRRGTVVVCKLCAHDIFGKEQFLTHFAVNHKNFLWSKYCTVCCRFIVDAEVFSDMLEHTLSHVTVEQEQTARQTEEAAEDLKKSQDRFSTFKEKFFVKPVIAETVVEGRLKKLPLTRQALKKALIEKRRKECE